MAEAVFGSLDTEAEDRPTGVFIGAPAMQALLAEAEYSIRYVDGGYIVEGARLIGRDDALGGWRLLLDAIE